MDIKNLSQEKHFKVTDLAKKWNLDPKTVRRMFKGMTDVFHDPHPERRNKRPYTTIRIPESVAYAEYAKRIGRVPNLPASQVSR